MRHFVHWHLLGNPPPPPASYELYCELGHFQNDVVIKLNADSIIVAIIAVLCPCVAPLSTAVIELLKFQRTYVYKYMPMGLSIDVGCVLIFQIPQYLMRQVQLLQMDGSHAAGLSASSCKCRRWFVLHQQLFRSKARYCSVHISFSRLPTVWNWLSQNLSLVRLLFIPLFFLVFCQLLFHLCLISHLGLSFWALYPDYVNIQHIFASQLVLYRRLPVFSGHWQREKDAWCILSTLL